MAIVFQRPKALLDVPTHYCPGCTHGIIHRLVAECIDELGIEGKTVGIAPVGCAVMAYNYFGCDMIEAPHGRAPAVATGVKRAKPEDVVFTYQGDGDLAAIGTAETVHSATRGENITVIFVNNAIYGMTGGQYSPTTPRGDYGTTAPYGNFDRSFDIAGLAYGAGASYAARGSAYHVQQTISLIQEGIRHQGFSIIDVASVCPTYYGRKNHKGSAVDMMKWQKENAVTQEQANKMTPDELRGKLIIGLLHQVQYPEFTYEYEKLIHRLAKEREANE